MQNRRLRRFFTSETIRKQGDIVKITPADTDHLRRILRLKEGDLCLVIDGAGVEAEASVSGIEGAQASLLIGHVTPPQNTTGIRLFVYPAFIQRGKMDELVRQMQELGVYGFSPTETERTIVKMTIDAKEKVAERWEKITQEAAKQSGSLQTLSIDVPRPLKDVLARIPTNDVLAVFHPGKESIPFKAWISTLSLAPSVHLFWGPEGGFSEKEMELFCARSAIRVGLGKTILKADTAVLGTVAALKILFS